jgi:hypothetical protein
VSGPGQVIRKLRSRFPEPSNGLDDFVARGDQISSPESGGVILATTIHLNGPA